MNAAKAAKILATAIIVLSIAALVQSASVVYSLGAGLSSRDVFNLLCRLAVISYGLIWLVALVRRYQSAIWITSIALCVPFTMIIAHIIAVWLTETDISQRLGITVSLIVMFILYSFVFGWWWRHRKDVVRNETAISDAIR